MKPPAYLFAILFIALFSSSSAIAAELRGSFSGYQGAKIPAGASIHVACGNVKPSTSLKSNGSYSIRGLPSSKRCTYLIKYPDGAKSKAISFNSGSGVVTINASLRKHGNTILLISK